MSEVTGSGASSRFQGMPHGGPQGPRLKRNIPGSDIQGIPENVKTAQVALPKFYIPSSPIGKFFAKIKATILREPNPTKLNKAEVALLEKAMGKVKDCKHEVRTLRGKLAIANFAYQLSENSNINVRRKRKSEVNTAVSNYYGGKDTVKDAEKELQALKTKLYNLQHGEPDVSKLSEDDKSRLETAELKVNDLEQKAAKANKGSMRAVARKDYPSEGPAKTTSEDAEALLSSAKLELKNLKKALCENQRPR